MCFFLRCSGGPTTKKTSFLFLSSLMLFKHFGLNSLTISPSLLLTLKIYFFYFKFLCLVCMLTACWMFILRETDLFSHIISHPWKLDIHLRITASLYYYLAYSYKCTERVSIIFWSKSRRLVYKSFAMKRLKLN